MPLGHTGDLTPMVNFETCNLQYINIYTSYRLKDLKWKELKIFVNCFSYNNLWNIWVFYRISLSPLKFCDINYTIEK